MSRFERRLGQDSSSPKPGGVPVCKLPKKNNRMMLSGFIDVNEKITNDKQNTTKQNIKSNSIIIEDITKEEPKYTDSKIKKIMNINEELKKLMIKTSDKNIRLILGHEIRINTLELNVDCLNDMKCEKIYEEQTMLEKDEKILVNSRKVDQIEILVKETLLEIEKKKKTLEMQDTEINKNIQNNINDINNIKENNNNNNNKFEKNNEQINEINNNIKEIIYNNNNNFENLNEEIRKRDETINNLKNYNLKIKCILEKIMSKTKKTELVTDLEELESINL